jgi:predicted RNA-binding protein with PUA-like domain
MNHWLLKSEPGAFGIDDLSRAPKRTAVWDGVRNYQARNMLRDSMRKGDQAFFYHSSCEVPGIAGIVSIVKEGYPDASAADPTNPHYDDRNDGRGAPPPRWFAVDVKLIRKFKRIITLDELRAHQSKELRDLLVLRRGNRLSVMPVSKKDWVFVLALE